MATASAVRSVRARNAVQLVGQSYERSLILGRVWDEFAGNNNTVDLLNPGVPLTVADNVFTHKAFGEVKGGLTLLRSAEAGRPT